MSASLRQTLAEMLAVRPAPYVAMLREIADRLERTACAGVLRAGQTMPGFVLPNAEGDLIDSDSLLARGPAVICFFRGDWCPFCRTTLSALQGIVPRIAAAGASLTAISPDSAGLVSAAKQRLGLDFELLSDLDNAVGLQFGAVYRVPDDYVATLARLGIDLAARHGSADILLPMPATFIVDPDGIVRYAHASGDITNRTEPETVLAVLNGGAPPAPR